jgi:hypothetical protein
MDMPKDDESYGQGEGTGQGDMGQGQGDMGQGQGDMGQGQGDMGGGQGQTPADDEEGDDSGGMPTA